MDSFFGIGLFELIMIAVIALMVMGPERLPGAMREVAKYMRQLRNISNEFQSQFSDELKMLDEINPRKIINEALDPNSTANSPAATTGAKATTAAAAKPPAAKPLAPKPVTTAPAKSAAAPLPVTPVAPVAPAVEPVVDSAAAPTITNGEPENSILPPARTQPAAVSAPLPSQPQAAPAELAPDSLPPAGARPAASVDLPPSSPPAHQNGSESSE